LDEKRDSCECNVIHEDIVNKVKKNMPKEEHLYDLAELFKVFGDTTRIKYYTHCLPLKCVCAILPHL